MADLWALDAEQAVIITLKKMLVAARPLDADKVQEAAVTALVDMTGSHLSESDTDGRSARRGIVSWHAAISTSRRKWGAAGD